MSGVMVRLDKVSLVQARAMSRLMLCSTGRGRATANTAAHMAVHSTFVGAPDWSHPLQLPAGVPCVMPAMEAWALTGPMTGMA